MFLFEQNNSRESLHVIVKHKFNNKHEIYEKYEIWYQIQLRTVFWEESAHTFQLMFKHKKAALLFFNYLIFNYLIFVLNAVLLKGSPL